jgi:hypothetical protein
MNGLIQALSYSNINKQNYKVFRVIRQDAQESGVIQSKMKYNGIYN